MDRVNPGNKKKKHKEIRTQRENAGATQRQRIKRLSELVTAGLSRLGERNR